MRAAINPVPISPATHRPAADAGGKQHYLGATSSLNNSPNEPIHQYTPNITADDTDNDPNYIHYTVIQGYTLDNHTS